MASAGVQGQCSHHWQAPRGPHWLPRSSLILALLWPWHVSDRRGDNGQSWPCEQMLMLCLARLLFLSALIKICYHCCTVLCRHPYKLWHFFFFCLLLFTNQRNYWTLNSGIFYYIMHHNFYGLVLNLLKEYFIYLHCLYLYFVKHVILKVVLICLFCFY